MTKAKKTFFSILTSLVFAVAIILTTLLIVDRTKTNNEGFVEEKREFALASYNLADSNTIPVSKLDFIYDDQSMTATFIGIQQQENKDMDSWKDMTLKIPRGIERPGTSDIYTVNAINTNYVGADGTSFSAVTNSQQNHPFDKYSTLQAYGSGITAIIIPDTVESINTGAFYGCASLVYFETPFLGTKQGAEDATASNNNASLHSMFSRAWTNVGSERPCEYYYMGSAQLYSEKKSVSGTWYLVDGMTSASLWYQLPCDLQVVKITDESDIITRAFFNIDSLVNVEINEGLDAIGDYAFASCDHLENVVLPKDIGSLPKGLFSECISLGTTSTIYLPSTIRSIPDGCFGGCTSLKKVYVPTTIDDICAKAFEDCHSLEYLVLYNDFKANGDYNTTTDPSKKGFNLPSGLKSIGNSAFANCTLMNSIAVPITVQSMGKLVFAGNPNLSSISLPFIGSERGANASNTDFGYIFSWTSIDGYFYAASQRTSTYYIPKALDSIVILGETYVVEGSLSNLAYTKNDNSIAGVETIVIEDNATYHCTTVAEGALSGCGALTDLTTPYVGTTLDDTSNFARIFGKTKPATGNFDSQTTYYVPNTLVNIKILKANKVYGGQFANLYYIEKVEFPADITEMDSGIFYNNQHLKELVLPFVGKNAGIWHPGWPNNGWNWWSIDIEVRNSLMWIFSTSSAAGHYCNTDLSWGRTNRYRYIPSSLKTVEILNDSCIDTYAFRSFTSLKTIKLNSETYGRKLNYVESGCMWGCSNLKTVDVPFIGYNTNEGGNNGAEHTIGWYFGTGGFDNSYKAGGYRDTYVPNTLTSVIVDGKANLTAINAYAFYGMKTLVTVDFKTNNISQIGWAAFYGCEKLTNFTYGDATSFTNISGYAFYNCKNVTDLNVAVPMYRVDGAKLALGEYSLAGSGVSTIDFERISTLGKYCLSNCLNLAEAIVKPNISTMAEGVFADCTFLNHVTLPANTAAKNLFKNCVSLTEIDITAAAPEVIPEGMFDGCENLVYNRNQVGGLVYNLEQVKEIGVNAFRNCKSLVGFELPRNLKTIRSGAFLGDTKLGSIIIPRSVETINSGVFTESQGQDFIIWVYQKEEERPSGWTNNWNCKNIVMVIDAVDDSNYEFDIFDTELQGYVITGVKSGVQLSEDVYLPTTHLSCPVVGISEKVFMNQTNVKTIVIPVNYVSFGINCFNNNKRIDLYFVSTKSNLNTTVTVGTVTSRKYNIVDETDSYAVLNNESKLIACGNVYYGDYWKFGTDGLTPEVKLSSLTYTFSSTVTPVYSGNAWDATTYPIVKVTTPAVSVLNNSIDDTVTNVIYSTTESNDTWNGLFDFKYTNNVLASVYTKANVAISLNGTKYQSYIQSSGYAEHFTGTAEKKFSIGKATIQLFMDTNESSNNFMRNFGKAYDGREYTLNVASFNDSTYIDCITISDFLDNYKITGKVYTTRELAGVYQISYAEYNSYIQRDLTVRTKANSTDVTSSFIINLYLKITISPKEVELHFVNGTENGDIFEYEYNGYKKSPELVAKAYPYGQPESSPINDCIVSAYTPSSNPLGWVPGDVIYTAYAELTNTGYNRNNYVVKEVSGVTITTPSGVTGILQKIKIVKAKVYISILDSNYVIDPNEECWSFDAWKTRKNYYRISGLKESTEIMGRLISNSNVADKTAYEKAEYKTGDSELDIIWEKQNFSQYNGSSNGDYYLFTKFEKVDGTGKTYYEYYNEMDYYETVVVDADVYIKYNDFDIEIKIGNSVYTYPLPTETINNIEYSKIIYYTDGQRVPVEITIKNKDKNGNAVTATLTYAEASLDSANQVVLGDEIKRITFKYKLQRLRFNPFDDNLAIHVEKSDVSLSPDIKVEYDREDYKISEDMKVLEHIDDAHGITIVKKCGTDQVITTKLLDAKKKPVVDNPIAPGTYYIHVEATEGAYFNACDVYIKFEITKRTITIYLDKVNAADQYSVSNASGYYTGRPYTVNVTSADLQAYNGLLAGDTFSGALVTKSDLPDVYTSDLDTDGKLKDWVWSPQWSIYSSSYVLISSYYNIVVTGSYEIKKLVMTVSSSGWTGNYDTLPHSITVNVSVPLTGYTIYYSEEQPGTPDENGNDGAHWSTYCPQYISPESKGVGYYRVYYKVVAANHETYYGYEDVTIITLTPTWDKPAEFLDYSAGTQYTGTYYISYDWFEHSLALTNVTPINATVRYALVSRGVTPSSYSTTIPTVVNEGEYTLYYEITCHDYEKVTGQYLFVVTNEFNGQFTIDTDYQVLLDDVQYDSSQATMQYRAGVTHTIKVNYLNTFNSATIYYSLDGTNWSEDPITIADANSYRIYYRLRARGMQTLEEYVDVEITPAEFENITVTNYIGEYDGELHTISVNGLDAYQSVDYVLYYAKVYQATYYDVTNSLWSKSEDFIKFKSVCNNELVYVRIVAKNYQSKTVSGTVTITQCTPSVTFNDGCEVQYKASKVVVSDLDINTIHDGNIICTWYAATFNELGSPQYTYDEDDRLNQAPTELGCYYVKISYVATANCRAIETAGYFKIVPRKVTLEYAESKQFTGGYLSPDFKVITGTNDKLDVLFERADGVAELPKELGQYKLYVYFATDVVNYTFDLPQENGRFYVIFTVTERSIVITIDIEKNYDGSIWEMQSIRDENRNWNNIWSSYVVPANGLVGGHIFTAHMYTNASIKGTYLYSTLSTEITLMKVKVEDVRIYDQNGNDVTAYYHIDYNIKVRIKLPDLNATFADTTITYDGLAHNIDPVVPSTIDTSNLLYYYKYAEDVGNSVNWRYTTGWLTQPKTFTNVGTYDIYIWISSIDYDDFYAKATLTITKAHLAISISDFDVVYDNNDHTASFTVTNCQTIDQNLANVKYYSVNDVSVADLRSLYTAFDTTNPNYNLYTQYGKSTMVNAGDYYMVVFFPGTVNYYDSYNNFDIVTIQKRPVYFSTGLSLNYSKTYDTFPYEITLGSSFTYVSGLLVGHAFDQGALIIAGTKSANAGIYFSHDGSSAGSYSSIDLPNNTMGFVFTSAFIYNSFGENVVDNYMPVIYNDALVIIINRANIPQGAFTAEDLEREYDGKPARPTITTPSDGELVYTYYKATETASGYTYDRTQICYETDLAGSVYNCCNVGFYYVEVSQLRGTNYNAPTYSVGAYVKVTKRTVEAEWSNLELEFTGQGLVPKAIYKDINGNSVDLVVNVYDNWVPYPSVIKAGIYMVFAYDSEDTNYRVINRGTDTTVSFEITPKEYTIYLYANGTSGKYITYEGVDRKWSMYIDGTYFDDTNSNYTGPNWLTGLSLQRTATDTQTAIIETITHTPGTYYGDDMFKITYAVMAGSLDVTDSIKFVVDGGVMIMSNKIDYIIKDSGVIEVPYKGSPYTIWDFVTLINPSNHASLSKLLYSTNGDFNTSTIDHWERTEVGEETVHFMFEYGGDQTVKDSFIVKIVPNDPYMNFNKKFDKTYDASPVSPETIKNGISSAQYNGIEVADGYTNLTYTYYVAGDLDHFIVKYENGQIIEGTGKTYPTAAGTYMVKITAYYDTNPPIDYVANYTVLEKWVEFTIYPSEVNLTIDIDKVVFYNETNGFGTPYYEEKEISNNPTIPTGYKAKLTFKLLSGQDGNGNAVSGIQRAVYTYAGTIVYDATASNYTITMLCTPLDGSTPYNINFEVTWKIYRVIAATATTSETEDDISYNYDMTLDYKLKAHYPYMNQEYSVVIDSTPTPYYLKATIADELNKLYTGSDIHGTLNTSYSGLKDNLVHFVDNYAKTDNNPNGYTYPDISTSDVCAVNPGTTVIYYKFTADGFEPYYGSYKITIGYINRVQTSTLAAYAPGEIYTDVADGNKQYASAEYNNGVFTVQLEAASDNLSANIALYNSSNTKIADLYKVSTGTATQADSYTGASIYFTKLGSTIPLTNIKDAGRYNYYVSIPASTFYKEITVTGIVIITKKVVNVSYSNVMSSLGDGTQVAGYVASFNGIQATDTINLANNIYKFTYSDGTPVTDLYITSYLTTNSWSTGTYSIGAGNLIVSGTQIRKNDEEVSRNYQLSLDNGIKITIDKGMITPASFTTTFTYNGQDQMFTAISGNPTNASVAYSTAADGTFGNAASVAQHKPGTYSVFVRFRAANFYDLVKEYTLKINKAPITLNVTDLTKEYDGVPVQYDRNLAASSGVTPSSVSYNRYVNGIPVSMSDEIPVDVGSYQIVIYVPGDANGYYEAGYFTKDFRITGREIQIVWKNTTLTYDGTSQSPTPQISDARLQAQLAAAEIQLTYTYTPLSSITGTLDLDHKTVGTYRVEVAVVGSNNYDFDPDTTWVLFSIVPRQVTITLNQYASYSDSVTSYSFGYKTLDPVTNQLIGYEALNIVSTHHMGTSRLQCLNYVVGRYTARQSFQWSSSRGSESPVIIDENSDDVTDNYQILYNLNFEINHSTIVPTITNYNDIYDGENHSIQVVVNTLGTGFKIEYTDKVDASNNPIQYSTTKPMYKDAGNYTVYVKISKDGYSDFYGTGYVNIAKAEANLAWADDQTPYTMTKTYDALPVAIPAVTSGIQNGTPEFLYTYLKKNDISGIYETKCTISVKGTNKNIISGSVPTEVGEYKLEVTIGSSNNYNSGDIDTYFEIEKREIKISLASPIVTDSKEYDAYRWSLDETSPKLNINNVVSGHTFNGIVQTVSANVGLYENQTDFEWTNNWTVKVGSSDVTSNYYVSFNLSVRITTAKMKVTVTDYENEFDGLPHYVKIKVTEPAGGYTIMYTTETDSNNDPINYQTSRISQTNTGTTTVYFIITCPNYDDYKGHGVIKIRGLSADGKWQSFVDDYEYTGTAYANPVVISQNTSTPVYRYYLASDFDMANKKPYDGKYALSTNPVNVGNYVVTASLPDDGQFDEFTLVGSFAISPKKVTVVWDNLNVTYTGEEQIPTAKYVDVNGQDIDLDVESNVNLMKAVGSYTVTAKFKTSDTGSSNYELDNATKTQTFVIGKKQITVPNISNDLEFTFGDDIIIKDIDGNIYTLGSDGTIQKIRYVGDINDPTDDYIIDYVNKTQTTLNDPDDDADDEIVTVSVEGFVYKLILSSDKNADGVVIQNHTITMKLDDYNNYEWDGVTSPGTDQIRVYKINRETFDANSKYTLVIACEKSNATFTYTGEAITPTYTLTVKSKATGQIVRTLYTSFHDGEFAGYTIAMSDNVDPGYASVQIDGINNYDFSVTKQFLIQDQAPEIIELVAGDKIHFMKVEVDESTSVSTFTETGVDRDEAYKEDIYLGGIYNMTFIPDIIPAFSNDSDKLQVYSRDHVLMYDRGNSIINGNDYTYEYFGTGYYVVLTNDSGDEIDRIYAILFGDTNGDGVIDGTDLNDHIDYNSGDKTFNLSLKISDVVSDSSLVFDRVYYFAMYTVRFIIDPDTNTQILQSTPDGSTLNYIIDFNGGGYDFNQDYIRS